MRIFTCSVFLLFAFHLSAQITPYTNKLSADILGIDVTLIDLESEESPIITTPPSSPVRTMAEWEELQSLVITWKSYPSILAEIVKAARLECEVIIVCETQTTVVNAKNTLTSAGVNWSSNVTFKVIPNTAPASEPGKSVWVRDYGPNCVYKNDVDSLYFVDWIYNRKRPNDDLVPQKLGEMLNIPVYATTIAPYDLVNTGGNFMSDGLGLGFASKLILNNNDQIINGDTFYPNDVFGMSNHNEAAIDGIMEEFMGIHTYAKMKVLPYDDIHHIDMHIKLLDEETLLVGQYPDSIADGPQIEANLQYILDNWTTSFGTPFKVIRIPMPPDAAGNYPDSNGKYRTYANAVFVNKSVLVPTYETQYDTTALRIWKETLPGYNIVPINCESMIAASGAVHCITKEIGVQNPLLIVHQPLPCQMSGMTEYPVFATLRHVSNIGSAKVFYTTDLSTPWQESPMFFQTGDSTHLWMGNIPQQADGSTVYYYIEATANSGKVLTRPLPAPAAYWKFCVNMPSDVTEVPVAEILEIYPNPSSGITVIPIKINQSVKGTIQVINALGQEVTTVFSGNIPAGNTNYFLNASTLPSGTYVVQMMTSNQILSKKLIVKR